MATLDRFEKEHREALNKYEKQKKQYQLETYLSNILAQRMLPLSNRVSALNRLIDQVIANVDKHEDQIDIIE